MHKQQGEKGSGFLITCDKNKQKLAIKDAYNFLSQFIEQIYGDIESEMIKKQLQAKGKAHDLQNQLVIRQKLKNKIRVLSSIDTNVNCLIFIKINENFSCRKINPIEVVNKIMKAVHQLNRQVSRFCHKILPVQRSFKAQHFKMLDEVDEMFQKKDNSEIKSWALNFKCRNNSKFNYKQILGQTEKIAKKYGHFVDIYYPQWTLCIQIVNHLMCLAIVEQFKQLDQYRLHKKGQKLPKFQQKSQKSERIQQKKQEKNRQIQRRQDKIKQNNQQIKQKNEKIENKQIQDKNTEKQMLLQQKIEICQKDDVDFI